MLRLEPTATCRAAPLRGLLLLLVLRLRKLLMVLLVTLQVL